MRRFAPSLFASLLTLVGLALFLLLGFWQLDRAEQKQALLAQADQGAESTVTVTVESAGVLTRYQRVTASGRYDSGRQVLLENMYSREGRPGYRVLTPFELASGGVILVDRGWIAPGATRKDLPQTAVSEAPRTIVGRLDELPRPGMRMGDQAVLGQGWPRPLHYPTHPQLEQVLGRAVASRIILLDPSQADGYERNERVLAHVDPGRHVGYAVQWFAFALVALVLFVIFGIRRARSNDGQHV